MGMYTEVNMGFDLKKETPPEVIAALKYMALGDEHPKARCEHPLFETDRWKWMLRDYSYYFRTRPMLRFEYDDITKAWFLSFVSNIKNYDSEWEKFLDWIGPHVDNYGETYLGTYRYEEDDLPTLLLFRDGKIVMTPVFPAARAKKGG